MSGHAHDRAAPTVEPARNRAVKRVLFGVLILNALVATTKLSVGAIVGATSLIADGVHSLLDGASNVVGLIGLSMAERPPDAGHPYGHQRFETLATLMIALLIGAGLYEILQAAWGGFGTGRAAPGVTWWSIGFVGATIVINLGISRYETRRGNALNSSILHADSAHTYADALAATAVLVAFIAMKLGMTWADPVATLVVAGFIAQTAWSLLRENIDVLADGVRLEPEAVHAVAMAVPGVLGVHQVRSRGNADWIYVDLHVQVEGSLTVDAAHIVSHEVVVAICEAFPNVRDVVAHIEPADHHAPLAPGGSGPS